MIGLDTNILVRYLAQDDAGQAALADKLVESLTDTAPGFVSFDKSTKKHLGMTLLK